MKTMADLLNELFRTHLRPDGREYTCSDVSRALDGAIDPSYLARMRKGKIENPTKHTLLLICTFFNSVGTPVEPNYFFPELTMNAHQAGGKVGYSADIDRMQEELNRILDAMRSHTQ